MSSVKKIILKSIILMFLIGCGKPSIHEAVATGNIEIVRLYLSAGVDVNLEGSFDSYKGKTLLGVAASNGYKEIAELLINNGADVEGSQGPLKWSPLHFAVWREHEELVDLLISKKADVNSVDVNGNTALHYAVFDGSQKIVALLIAKGADVNLKNYSGVTPLHNASNKGPAGLIELLIANGADVNSLDIQGRTPIDNTFCCGGAETEITMLLRKFGGKEGVDVEVK